MNIVDRIVNEWAFRCKKGYPDLNNPEDMKILNEIYSEFGIQVTSEIKEEQEVMRKKKEIPASIGYAAVIKHALGEEIPEVKGNYTLPSSTGELTIQAEDLETFKKLYKISPPKAGQEVGEAGSKGSGHGEIAVYWLLSKNYDVKDTRGGGNADLILNNTIGLEIKSFPETANSIVIGRIGAYSTVLKGLNTLFSISALYVEFKESPRKKLPPNAIHATAEDLRTANKALVQVANQESLRSYKAPFIQSMFKQLDDLINTYGKDGVENIAGNLMKALLIAKFEDKPGDGGYLLNVTEKGKIECIHILLNKLRELDPDKVLSEGTKINQGILYFNKALFT